MIVENLDNKRENSLTKREGNIYISITNNVVNFKIRIPEDWLNEIGINTEERQIYISFEGGKIFIEKMDKPLFSTLSPEEKIKQVKKCEYEYLKNNKHINNDFKSSNRKEMIDFIASYFNVTYRTIYRYINNEVDYKLEDVEMLPRQKENIRKSKVMFKEGKKVNLATITIPSALGFLFFQGQTKEELGIKNMTEVIDKNKVVPIWRVLKKDKIEIDIRE